MVRLKADATYACSKAVVLVTMAITIAAHVPTIAAPQTPQQPVEREAPAAPPADATAQPEAEPQPPTDADPAPEVEIDRPRRRRQPVFRIGGNLELDEGEEISEAIVMSGAALIAGWV